MRKIRLWTTNLLVFKCTINQACFGRKSAKLFDAELTTSLLIRLLERKGKLVQNGGLVPPCPSPDQVVQRAEGGAMCQLVSLVHSPSWVGFCKRLPEFLQKITRSAFARQSLLHRVGASLWGNQILRKMTEGLPAIFSFRDQQLDHWNVG